MRIQHIWARGFYRVQCLEHLIFPEGMQVETDQVRARVSALPIHDTLRPTPAEDVIDVLMKISTQENLPSGTVLFAKGDPSIDDGVILLEGEVSVMKVGFPEIIAAAPELLGEMGRLNPTGQRTATVTAVTELTLLRFKWTEFMREAGLRLSEAELEKISSALQEYAWQHFTQ